MRKKKDKIMEMRLVVDNDEERSKSCEKAYNHHIRFLAHQFGSPLFVFKDMRNFRVSSQINRVIEKVRPGIPKIKKGRGLNKDSFTGHQILYSLLECKERR